MNIMKNKNAVTILAVIIFALLIVVPSTKALTFSYSSGDWSSLTITGNPNIVKPGDTLTLTISGTLTDQSQSTTVNLNLVVFADTVSQPSKIIAALPLSTSDGSLSASYQIPVPSDSINNTYLFANITNGNQPLLKTTLALIQNPTYVELQQQITELQIQVDSLTAQKSLLLNQTTDLQIQVGSLQFNNTNLQKQVNSLSGQTANLTAQIDDLRNQNTDLQSKNNTASILVYLSTFVAVAFIVATAAIIFMVTKGKKRSKSKEVSPLL